MPSRRSKARKKPRAGSRKKPVAVGGRPARWWLLGAGLALLVTSVLLVWPYWRLSGQFGGLSRPHPSRLYGQPWELSRGDFVSVGRLEAHFVELGYRGVSSDPTQGLYRRTSDPVAIEAFLRPYPTLQGWTTAQHFSAVFSGHRLTRLELAGQEVEQVVMEPPMLASYYGSQLEERLPERLDSLARELVLAVLAAEDAAFFEHAGLSPSGIVRAAWVNLRSGEVVQGGSTLTQQLVKNLYLTHERTFLRKAREAVLSVFLELRFEKTSLLETYLNEIYMGREGAVSLLGMGAAARAYFGKDARELSLNEAAVLAGMIQSPGNLNPRDHPEAALRRRDLVVREMVELGWLEAERAEAVLASPLPEPVRRRAQRHQGYLMDAVAREARERFGISRLADAGLTLLSSLDPDDQAAAEEAVIWGLERLGYDDETTPVQGVLLSIDPRTGGILAYVGGRDYQQSQFDRIGQARRQPGSAFKPVVFAAAFSDNVATPATLLDDSPLSFRLSGKTWTPQNVDRRFRGAVSARETLERSINVPTVRLAEKVGWERVVAMARRLGISGRLRPLPSIALGAFEVTPLELMSVYGTLANGGLRPDIHLLRGVLSEDGRRLAAVGSHEPQRVLEPGSAYLVNYVLQGALDHGTGRSVRSRGIEGPLAGKTGTTNGGRDSWFVGYAPNRATLTWVGFDDNRATRLSGSTAALPMWARFAVARRPVEGYAAFEAPPEVHFVPIDVASGQMASGRCTEVRTEAFLESSFPLEMCTLHAPRQFRRRHEPTSRNPERGRWWRRVLRRD